MAASRKGLPWGDDELHACVRLYLRLRDLERNGVVYNKSDECTKLGAELGRERGGVEFKMRSIAYVLHCQGRFWIEGWKPAENAGVNIASTLERYLAEEEGKPVDSTASFESRLKALQKTVSQDGTPPEGNREPKAREVAAVAYDRDPKVVAFVLFRAKGVCECCGIEAPFIKPDGSSYLEAHHVIRLADGGEDTPKNAVAVCPNCHRELHFGIEKFALMQELQEKLRKKPDV